jgi:hypothetical protein
LAAAAVALALQCAGNFAPPGKVMAAVESKCIGCHEKATPGIVKDFGAGKMGALIDCSACHGSEHTTAQDTAKAKMPSAPDCAKCHPKQAERFAQGKHALAWAAMEAMPRTAHQPGSIIEGLKGCGGCHRIGKDQGKCDSCHTRHKYSVQEAKNPLACATCHMGFDHPQWEMWSTSKHGVICQIEGNTGRAPTCQRCHMSNGDHRVMTAWGFLALRLPETDEEWMKDRATILKGLGVLDPDGKPTARLDLAKNAKVARLAPGEWQKERDQMLQTCGACHSNAYAKEHLDQADATLKAADHLMAQGIETVAGLYRDGLLQKQADQPYPYPDILFFYDVRTSIEEDLYEMFLEHRMRTFQGAFHANPDYSHWYGWAAMKKALVQIEEEANRIRKAAAAAPPASR